VAWKGLCVLLLLDHQAEFFGICGWLVKIYGCFSAKRENCGEGILRLKIPAAYQICNCFLAKREMLRKKLAAENSSRWQIYC